MYLFMYLFVTCLDITSSSKIKSELIDAYLDASKSAQLINFIQRLKDNGDLLRRFSPEVNKDLSKRNYEEMKLLQKNYDTSKKIDINKTRVNVQYISNPEVLDIYRKGTLRRDADIYTLQKPIVAPAERHFEAFKNKRRQISYPKLHYLSNPEVLDYYRRLFKERPSQSKEDAFKSDLETFVGDSTYVRVDPEKVGESSDQNGERELEHTLNLVKPMFVPVFDELKAIDHNNENEDTEKSNNDDSDKKTALSYIKLHKNSEIENQLKQMSKAKGNKGDLAANIESDIITLLDSVKHVEEEVEEPPNMKTGMEKSQHRTEHSNKRHDEDNSDNMHNDEKKQNTDSNKSFDERDGVNEYRNKGDIKSIREAEGNGWERSRYRDSSKYNNARESIKKYSSEVTNYMYNDKKRFEIESVQNEKLDENDLDRSSKKKKGRDWDKSVEKFNKNNKWDKNDDKWNRKNEETIDWNDKNEDNWNKRKKDKWNDRKEDRWNNKKTNNWNNKKTNNWNNKREDNWNNKKQDKWNNKKSDWHKESEVKLDTKNDDWNRENDNWDTKKDVAKNKKDNWDSGYGKKKKSDDWVYGDKKGKKTKNYDYNSREEKKKKNHDADDMWDKKQTKYDLSYEKDKKSKKGNSNWGSYGSFKNIKDKPVSYEETRPKKTYSKEESGFKPQIHNNWDLPRPKKEIDRMGSNQKGFFGRTPIPFHGSRPLFD